MIPALHLEKQEIVTMSIQKNLTLFPVRPPLILWSLSLYRFVISVHV